MPNQQPFVGAAIGGAVIKAALPSIIGGIVKAVASRHAPRTSVAPGRIAEDVVKEIIKNPVIVNELNAEKPYQSRVAVGSTAAAAGAVGGVSVLVGAAVSVLNATGMVQIGPETAAYSAEVINAVVTLWGAVYALYGRFRPGLKPLFSGK